MTPHDPSGGEGRPSDLLEETLRQMRAAVGDRPIGDHFMRRLRRRTFLRGGILTCAGLACAGSGLAISQPDLLTEWDADISTHTGKTEQIVMDTGAHLMLAPRSAIKFGSDNSLSLLHGRLIADTTRIRPAWLRIETRHGIIELGTQEAEIKTDRSKLEVLSHDASIHITAHDGQNYRLKAGERLKLSRRRAHIYPAEWSTETAWTSGDLIVENALMQDVVEAFRPYWPGPLYVSGRAARIPVAGVFSLILVPQSLAQIAETFPVEILDLPFRTKMIVSKACS